MLRRILGTGPSTPEVSVEAARDRQQSAAIVLDVREPGEWAAGHAPGARHIPLGDLSRRARELPSDRDLLVICRSGNRSARAANVLLGLGFSRVTNVRGGMLAWARAGLPVVRR